MLRRALSRCASAGTPLTSRALTKSFQPRLLINRTTVHSLRASVSPIVRLSSRQYSSDAAAAEASPNLRQSDDEPIAHFEELAKLGVHPKLIRSITEGFGYDTMTDVQSKSIVAALQGKDMVAQAKTGTGKTLAFLIPIMQRMIQDDPRLGGMAEIKMARSDDIRGLILSPTRELAEQIAVEAKRLARGTGIVVQIAVGGMSKGDMLRKTRREGCHLLVGTPGRVSDLLNDERSGVAAPNLAAFVLDEADRMLDVGFAPELQSIQDALPSRKAKVRQTMLFSATIAKSVVGLAKNMVRQDEFMFVQTVDPNEIPTHEKVPQKVVMIPSLTNLYPCLYELIEREHKAALDGGRPFKAMVFFGTKSMTELSGKLLEHQQRTGHLPDMPRVYSIHGKLSQQQRTNVAGRFRRAKSAILVTTDVTARGMDFPDVTHVIQVNMPDNRDTYIHRIGRTGRQGKEGEGWLFLTPSNLKVARQELSSLPLKPDTSLECASIDAGATDELPAQFEAAKAAYNSVSKVELDDCYQASFGKQSGNRMVYAEEVHHWVRHGWGWDQPPTMSRSQARNRGVEGLDGFNIVDRRREDRGFDRREEGDFGRNRPESEDSFDIFSNRYGRDDRNQNRRGNGRFSDRNNDRYGDRNSNRQNNHSWM